MIKQSELNRSHGWRAPFGYVNSSLDLAKEALHEKIAAQDKTLREYEKKMSEMGDTILRLRKGLSADELCQRWVDRINALPDPPKERRICTECAHVLIDAQGGLSRCALRRHPIYDNFVSCDIERGFKPAHYAFVCGPEGLYWTPKVDRRKPGVEGVRRVDQNGPLEGRRTGKDRRAPKEETLTSASVGPGGGGGKRAASCARGGDGTSWATKDGDAA